MQKATKIPRENLPRVFLTTNTPYFTQNFQALHSNLAEQQIPRFPSFSLFRVTFSTSFRCLHFSIKIYFCTIIVSLSIRGKLVFRRFLTNTCNFFRISNAYFSFRFISYLVVPKVAFFCNRFFLVFFFFF